MHIGEEYRKIFQTYKTLAMTFAVESAALMKREQSLFQSHLDGIYSLALHRTSFDDEKAIREVAQNIVQRMVWTAATRFAPKGSSLDIDKAKLFKACGLESEKAWLNLDPVKVWDYLETTYGGERGEEEAWRQQAAVLIYEFGLHHKEGTRVVGGKTVLDVSVFIDSLDKKWSNKNKLCYHSSEKIGKILSCLKAFAGWTGRDGLVAIVSSLDHLTDSRATIVSRASYGGFGLKVVTFLRSFEFHFDRELAEQLQIFLSLYGAKTDDQRVA